MGKSGGRSYRRPVQQQPQESPATNMGTILAAGAGAGIANAGGTTITTCGKDDNSFYCQFVKGFNIFKMILFIIGILVIVYILYTIWAASRKSTGRGRR